MRLLKRWSLEVGLAALTVGATAGLATAALKATTPAEACGYMADQGLSTRGWKNYHDNEFGCSSPYHDIGPGFPLPNNLAYYAEGKQQSVALVKLVLNVNNRTEAKSGHTALVKAAEALASRVTGEKLPGEISRAILEGRKASAKLGNTTVEVLRIDWPTGKGYEVKVIFQ